MDIILHVADGDGGVADRFTSEGDGGLRITADKLGKFPPATLIVLGAIRIASRILAGTASPLIQVIYIIRGA